MKESLGLAKAVLLQHFVAQTYPDIVRPNIYTNIGPSIRKMMKNYEYVIKCESEYLLQMKKEIITNYTIKKGDKNHKDKI